jgi:molybdate transport system permease protein
MLFGLVLAKSIGDFDARITDGGMKMCEYLDAMRSPIFPRILLWVFIFGFGPCSCVSSNVDSADDVEPVVVYAETSLSDVLGEAAEIWTRSSGISIVFQFGVSSRLAMQTMPGSPVDLFISSDVLWMNFVEERDRLDPTTRTDIASNRLVLVIPADQPVSKYDLSLGWSPDRFVLASTTDPAGRSAEEALRETGIWTQVENRVVRAEGVRKVLDWVSRGEVEAGVVYRSDALVEPQVKTAYTFPRETHPPIRYIAAVPSFSDRRASAASFLEFLHKGEGQELFEKHGFSIPDPDHASGRRPPPTPALPEVLPTLLLSLLVGLLAILLISFPAIGTAWVLARFEFAGKSVFSALVMSPLILPPAVTGYALLACFSHDGVLGRILNNQGVQVPFGIFGAVLAAATVSFPLFVWISRRAFECVDPAQEEVAASLGLDDVKVFRVVTLPLAAPGILAAAGVAYARALGEFGATLVLAGNIPGSTQTLSLAIYGLMEAPAGRQRVMVLVAISVVLCVVSMAGVEVLFRRQRERMGAYRG